jgi:hypothetical protein
VRNCDVGVLILLLFSLKKILGSHGYFGISMISVWWKFCSWCLLFPGVELQGFLSHSLLFNFVYLRTKMFVMAPILVVARGVWRHPVLGRATRGTTIISIIAFTRVWGRWICEVLGYVLTDVIHLERRILLGVVWWYFAPCICGPDCITEKFRKFIGGNSSRLSRLSFNKCMMWGWGSTSSGSLVDGLSYSGARSS